MSTLMEEGELPEEGEITEDEEEQISQNPESSSKETEKFTEKKDSSGFHSKKNFAFVSTGPSTKTSKYRDYDDKITCHSDASQSCMTSSWISGTSQQRRSQTTNTTSIGRTSDDGNRRQSDDGSAGNSPKSLTNHKSRSVGVNESMDQDFRRIPFDVGDKENDEDDPFGMENDEDNDYRQVSFEQKRRHMTDDSAPFATKRAKPSALIDPFGSGEPMAGDGFDESTMNAASYDESAGGGYYRRSQRPPPPHWASHTICKFFREGYCRDGDNCAFSHNSNRRTELCKFYVQGFCKRGMNCSHLHGEFPCKSFHRGGCTNEACPFSHRLLDDFTRPIFEQALHDEEVASNISLPSHPQKRKVLLPQGPETVDREQTEKSPLPADTSSTATTTANAPPSLMAPSRQQSMTIQQIKQRAAEDKALAAAGTFGFFNPVPPTAAAKVPAPTTGAPLIPPPTFIAPPTTTSAEGATPMKPPPVTLGAFATPLALNGGQRTHGASHHHGGFYHTPTARVANMPPPALLTVPPPLATVTTATTATAPPPTMIIPPPSVVVSSGGFFNQPAIVVPSPAAASSTAYQPTQHPPSITTSLFGNASTTTAAAPIAPSTSSPMMPSLISSGLFGPSSSSSSTTKLSVEEPPPEEKPLAGMFSGGFFGNSSSMKKESAKVDAPSTTGGLSISSGDSGGFNISAMLEKITQQATASSASLPVLPSLNSLIASTASKWENESPASPTNYETSPSTVTSNVKMIPIVREWKLYLVDMSKNTEDELNVDLKWIGQISSGSYKNDPRLKKLAEKQFDLVTKTLEMQSNSTVAKPSEQAMTTQPSISSGGSSGDTSPSKKSAAESTVPRPADPRVKAPIDPRKRSAPSQPAASVARPPEAAGLYSDFFNTSFSGATALKTPMAGEPPNKLPDDIFQSMIQQQLKLVNQMQQQHQQLRPNNNNNSGATADDDVDHRTRITALLCPPLMSFLSFPPPPIGQKVGFPPPNNPVDSTCVPGSVDGAFTNSNFVASGGFSESFAGQRFGGRRGGGEFQPRFPSKPRSTDGGQNGPRWNRSQQQQESSFANRGFPKRNSTNSGQSPAQSQPAAVSPPTVPAAPQQPISLREKRKNNEYESPLARMSLSRY